jgi:hypothetical protein
MQNQIVNQIVIKRSAGDHYLLIKKLVYDGGGGKGGSFAEKNVI